jgi:hypothetical protein
VKGAGRGGGKEKGGGREGMMVDAVKEGDEHNPYGLMKCSPALKMLACSCLPVCFSIAILFSILATM